MSLQVWLPLINDYKNYGLSDLEFSRSTKYRYIRFVIDTKRGNKDNYTQLSMFQFLDVDNNVYSYPSGTTVSTSMSNYSSSEGPGNILDGNVNTKFCCPWSAGGYLQINLGGSDGIDISKYSRFRWYTANDADWRDPTSFRVLFSTDGTNFIEGVTVTNASITTSRHALAYVGNCLSDGKIGQTCHHNYSNSEGGLLSDKKLQSVGNNVSMFAWVNFDNFAVNPIGIGGTHTIIGDGYSAGTGMGFNVVTDGSKKVVAINTGTGNTRTWGDYRGITNILAGTWYHIGFTYNGSQIKIYVNGVLDATHNYSGQSNPADYVHVASWARDGLLNVPTIFPHYKPIGRINDFRIYDHVLSPKEIKLLSQGLVAHYQLKGMGATNYLKGAGKFTENSPLVRKASDTSVMNDSYIYHEWAPNDIFAVLPSAGTYTFSTECDGVGSGHQTSGTTASQRLFSFFLQNTSSGTHYHFAMSRGADGRWYGTRTDLVAGTYKVRTNLYAADNVDYTLQFWDMKVTAGSYDPSDTWCPHEEDELYTAMRVDSSLWTDCSGYGNTLEQVGTIPVVGNSARYGNCIDFNQTGYLKKSDFGMTTTAFTIAFWINPPSSTNAQHFICGTFNNFTGNGFGMWRDANGTGYSALYRSAGESAYTGLTTFSPDIGTWNHVAYVYTGSQGIYYKNGVEAGRVTGGSGGAVSHPVLYLGNSLYNNAPSSETDEASMSDFRFYATALSATDIADLYGHSASLTKDGTLMSYDFHENKQNAIGKDGIVSTGGFNDKAVPTYDMKIKALDDGSTWARIHHLDLKNDKTCFANAAEVAKCVNKNNRYSRMGIVDRYKAGGEYEFMLTYPTIKKTVPAGYTELEYIQATGSQYIRTGVYGYADGSYVRGHRWEFDIEFENNGARQLMGYGPNGGEYWGLQTSGYYGVGGNTAVSAWSGRDTIVHDYSGGTAGGNTLWANNATSNVGGNLTTSQEYTLFNLKWGSDTGYWCYAKLYRCKCIQGTTLIRDFVPAMRNSDGVIGLFDVVNNAFYTNAGSGYFLCNYSWLNYIEGTGTQYINTGIAENAIYGIEMKCLVTGLAVNWQSLLSGTLDNFTIGSVDANKNAFYLRLRTTEVCRPSGMYSDKINTISIKNGLVHLNGSLVGTYTHGALSTATGALYVFANNALSRYGKMRLYDLKIYDANGNVSRDFIPCNYGGSIGLFDNVTQAFYGNAGTGAFQYGGGKNNYQWLDYVESSGTQYINTGFAPTSNSRIVIRASSSGPYSVYGMTGDGTSFNLTGNGNGMYYYWGGQVASTVSNWFNQVHTFEQNKNVSYIDGSAYYTHSATTWSTSLPIFLFARNNSGSVNDIGGTVRIYSCQLYENGALVRDYVPCVSPSGKVGLYDKVTKRFYGNSGTGNLIAGTAKESIPMYNRWTQTSLTTDVNQGDNISFKPIFTSWPQHCGPLKPAQATDTAYDCDVKGTGNWYSPIGQYTIWSGGIPAADSSAQLETELWVRTDRFADEDQFNIYDGSITATDYIEI